jgi:mannitol/fructose-specific phosphotransferase system IIA component (Ntr-type)
MNENAFKNDLTDVFVNKGLLKEQGKRMLNEMITLETIQVMTNVKDWKEAIRTAAEPLLKKGSINQDYVKAMINNVLEMGPYIVVAPRIALAHARPEQGVNQMGISLLCLKESVSFSKEDRHDVNLIIVLAAVDSETHLTVLSQLARLLSDDNGLSSIFHAESALEVMPIINQYSTNKEV